MLCKASHNVGQIDFYVRLFNEKVKLPDDNPTIGIVLCADIPKRMPGFLAKLQMKKAYRSIRRLSAAKPSTLAAA